MQNAKPAATRRAILTGSLAATTWVKGLHPDRRRAAAEGQPGPGRILIWVDERHWRALMAAAAGLRPPRR